MRSVRVIGCGASGQRVSRDYDLNGTTAVSIGNDWSFIQRLEGRSGTSAVGNVYCSSAASGVPTVAQIQQQITAGGGKSMTATYRVPTGMTAWITGWAVEAITADMDARLRATVSSDTREPISLFLFQDTAYMPSNNVSGQMPVPWLRCPAGATIKISAIPSSATANARCNAGFDVIELDD